MNESKHTMGPWVTNGGIVRTIDANGITVRKIATVHGDFAEPEKVANARLIAAAPDLLAFAKRVMADHRAKLPSEARDLYGGGCGCPQCEQAAAAIQKAEGK